MSIVSRCQGALQIAWRSFSRSAEGDQQFVAGIREAAACLRSASDQELRHHFLGSEKTRRDVTIVDSFALVTEAIRRILGFELYDVQMMAGLAMARGAIAEMQTGEGKTLAACLPAAYHALNGKAVHLATPNSYLARRDFELLADVYRLLGVSVSFLDERPGSAKRAAYSCAVVYGTGYEFGFDYLRDQVTLLRIASQTLGKRYREIMRGLEPDGGGDVLQSQHQVAIIDEIDSVLIDEACLPLVLSSTSPAAAHCPAAYLAASKLAQSLKRDKDFTLDDVSKHLVLTEDGLGRAHGQFGSFKGTLLRPWSVYVEQALRAWWLLKIDVDYIIRDGQVVLVDQCTGRLFEERSWRDGLHQAVEAKEGLTIAGENATAARMSRQRYFKLYESVCGMTGTATGSEHEFWQLYRLPVVSIPLAMPSRRTALPLRSFIDAEAKWNAIVRDISERASDGRPVLIGTKTIENSHLLARRLGAAGLSFHLLNGTQDENEAAIVAQAGGAKSITVATNMAGRGTDIKLGDGVAELGGLHVIGVEFHESTRLDRQLHGRAGRQGDPGSFQFFIAADDVLLKDFAPALANRMKTISNAAGEIEQDLSTQILAVQRRAEAINYRHRRQLLAYDDWLDGVMATLAKRTC